MAARIARVAVPVPLRRTFDFLIPSSAALAAPGMRVVVPFRRRRLIGVITEFTARSELRPERLKSIISVLDDQPVVPQTLQRVLQWAADYYHHPIGEVWQAALPVALRRGLALTPRLEPSYRITAAGLDRRLQALRRSPAKQRIVAAALAAGDACLTADQLEPLAASWRQIVKQLVHDGWLEPAVADDGVSLTRPGVARPQLNPAQRRAVSELVRIVGGYRCTVLFGITGSGKTEVYLHLVEEVLQRGRQVLVLVPEIGLTPQLIDRFRARFKAPLVVLHSALADGERHKAWWRARSGEASIVLGTRSAVFTPLAHPGAIIVDEEHDLSFKQQDGFRYHARDLAVYRARLEKVPVVLGSATPSLETLANIGVDRYARVSLPARTGGAELPSIHYLDMRRLPAQDGISKPLVDAIRARLESGEQSLLFLNRRGYAPVLFCTNCGWQAHCGRCDAKLTLHRSQGQLRCHHCAAMSSLPEACPECGGAALHDLGSGTQKIETTLTRLLPAARVLRIDRDSTRRKDALEQRLNEFNAGHADVLVGTQLLAKGHDFAKVTLVGVLNADQGLFSVDFRAMEHLCQQIIQVAGRAGRGEHQGEVLIQTMQPEHPYFALLRDHDYEGFAKLALAERKQAHCPPFAYFALLRAESTRAGAALEFLRQARGQAQELRANVRAPGVSIMDAVPSPMEKRAGRYRAQLLLSADQRSQLHALLSSWLPLLESSRSVRQVRWSVDVDPMEMY